MIFHLSEYSGVPSAVEAIPCIHRVYRAEEINDVSFSASGARGSNWEGIRRALREGAMRSQCLTDKSVDQTARVSLLFVI
jgi:hypothetical protein